MDKKPKGRKWLKWVLGSAGVLLAIGIIGLISDQAIRFLHRRAFRYLG